MDTAHLHAGEREVQRRVGVHKRMAAVMGQVVRNAMPDQHRELFGKLPTLVVGSLDAQRRPWASMLHGAPGFVSAPDAQHLRIDALPAAGDPWVIQRDTPLGLLGLEPQTRRRNRMNGSVVALDAQGFTLQVDQSFGNCPQYIQARTPQRVERGTPPPAVAEGPLLSAAAQRLVRSADTLFIASASPNARAHAGADGVDVSHRGGLPGFVHLSHSVGASMLSIPDYRGNNFFNTLGNLVAHPFAGLLFIDHPSGHLLQLTGRARVLYEGDALAAFDGAQRLMQITVDAGVWRPHALPLAWSAPEFAPQLTARV